ncbi:response regulator [Ascidiimonas sp. W6]|uniref:response regulator n=1 Tax=Ascidiimonas meishanensis TaxID=3128903 RepID=UPI0030EB37E9
MFQKILFAEDIDNISEGVKKILKELHIDHIDYVQYCDDAYLKIRKAELEKEPYDLCITDLSFVKDHRVQKIKSGVGLIEKLKKESPYLKLIVYSVEDKMQTVRKLMDIYHVNAYVCKGRKGLKELQTAIIAVYAQNRFLSPQVSGALHNTNSLQIDAYDLDLLNFLATGHTQEQIAEKLKNEEITPSSLSSIEKKINRMKSHFNATNSTHLIAVVKDLGLI